MDKMIKNLHGEDLSISVEQYNRCRQPGLAARLETFCHAPFASMDFGPGGEINVCNHYHGVIGHVQDQDSFLEVWRGSRYMKLRAGMSNWTLPEKMCRHCARQLKSDPSSTFAVEQYDQWPADSLCPEYPTVITFRLSNLCNLACIMCNGSLSSRIRRERENLPDGGPSPYGERFFEELRSVLPELKYTEFFGGEPFLCKEHLRIFEMIRETGSNCAIYVNTNGLILTDKIKKYLEELNFIHIAISMDACDPALHGRVRIGIDHDLFLKNFKWYLDLRKRRNVEVSLNVSELRQNWYEIPALFRFAAENDCFLHINCCIHPKHCTLYDLPSDQLQYVYNFLKGQKAIIRSELSVRNNYQRYDYLLSLLEKECSTRVRETEEIEKPVDKRLMGTDGLLASPHPGKKPFESPDLLIKELGRIFRLGSGAGGRMMVEIEERIRSLDNPQKWEPALKKIHELLSGQMSSTSNPYVAPTEAPQ